MRRIARRLSTYWHILTRRDRVTSEMDDEMRFHVEMETDRLRKAHGLPVEEARRRAQVAGPAAARRFDAALVAERLERAFGEASGPGGVD